MIRMLAAAVVVAAAAVAGAGYQPATGAAAAQHRCTANYKYHYDATQNPGTSYAEWTDNTCRYWLRPFAHCHNGRQAIVTTGKWVQGDNVRSNDNCTASFPSLTGGGVDKKNCSTCSSSRHWLWGNVKTPHRSRPRSG